jgi:hypothetical protein
MKKTMQDGYREMDIATHVALIDDALQKLHVAIRCSRRARITNAARIVFIAVSMFALGSFLGAMLKAAP